MFKVTVFTNQVCHENCQEQDGTSEFYKKINICKSAEKNIKLVQKHCDNYCYSVSGAAATMDILVNSTAQHLAKDVESVGSLVISRASVEVKQDIWNNLAFFCGKI